LHDTFFSGRSGPHSDLEIFKSKISPTYVNADMNINHSTRHISCIYKLRNEIFPYPCFSVVAYAEIRNHDALAVLINMPLYFFYGKNICVEPENTEEFIAYWVTVIVVHL
jgi:hypothetical protein